MKLSYDDSVLVKCAIAAQHAAAGMPMGYARSKIVAEAVLEAALAQQAPPVGWCGLCEEPLADGHVHPESQWEEAGRAKTAAPTRCGLNGCAYDAGHEGTCWHPDWHTEPTLTDEFELLSAISVVKHIHDHKTTDSLERNALLTVIDAARDFRAEAKPQKEAGPHPSCDVPTLPN